LKGEGILEHPGMAAAQIDQLYLGSSRCARPLPRGVTGHVAHPVRSIETRSFPNSLVATLAILHSMSRVPRAPFFLLTSSRCHASQIVEQDLHIPQRRPIIQHATAQSEAAVERRIGEIRAAVSLQSD